MDSSSQPSARKTGQVVVISGPSGAGKTTLVRLLLKTCSVPLEASISATTRPRRPSEVEGVDYHFLSPEEFQCRREAGEFLECFEVFGRGDWYGTLKSEVAPRLAGGKSVVLEIDVHGAMAIVEQYPAAVTIFVMPANAQELERRLSGRGTENEHSLSRRLEVARREMAYADQYKYRIVNENLDQAVADICEILKRHA
jgi:guanylate kinase